MIDYSHLNALEERLVRERARLYNSKTPCERELRQVWVDGVEKEIASERKFLGLPAVDTMTEGLLSIDEILEQLEA